MTILILLVTAAVGVPLGSPTVSDTPGNPEIERVITDLMAGLDRQDGPAIARNFAEGAALFAVTPDGSDVIAVSAADFAELHASGRFGGQERSVTIESLDLTDDLMASVKVRASNSDVS